ncbi:MAG: PEP-CTERM sorting domain-containing protein [Fimbriimonadales bacterium]
MRTWYALFLCVVVVASAQATIIEFTPNFTPTTIPFDYASRVNASGLDSGGRGPFNLTHGETPNIVVTMFTADSSRVQINNLFRWSSGYGSLTDVAYHANGQYAVIRFTADAGYWARLHGFRMAGWPNTDRILPLLEIRVDGSVIFSQTNTAISGATFTQFTFDPNVYKGNEVEIFFGNDWNVGIDDIEFSQELIPEPASLLALGAGLIGLARLRRR